MRPELLALAREVLEEVAAELATEDQAEVTFHLNLDYKARVYSLAKEKTTPLLTRPEDPATLLP